MQLGAVTLPSAQYKRMFQLTLAQTALPALAHTAAPSPSPERTLRCRLRVGTLSAPNSGSAAHHVFPFLSAQRKKCLPGMIHLPDFRLEDDKNNAFFSSDSLKCLSGKPYYAHLWF